MGRPQTLDKEEKATEVRLLASALQVFSEKGYEGTSIREIIEGAGVTRPVLYYYFQNKEDLFVKLIESNFALVVEKVERVLSLYENCQERLAEILVGTFELAETQFESVRLILQVFFAPPKSGPGLKWMHHLAPRRFRLLEEVMRQGLARKEISGGDARSLALLFQGMMDIHIMAKSDRPDIHLSRELAVNLAAFFVSGAAYADPPRTVLVSPLISYAHEPHEH